MFQWKEGACWTDWTNWLHAVTHAPLIVWGWDIGDYSNVLNPIGFYTTYKKLWEFLTCTYMYHGGDPRYNISNTSLSLHVACLCVLFKHFFISNFLCGICNLLLGSLLVLLVLVLMWIDNWERCLKCKSHLVVKKLVMIWNKPWKSPSPCRSTACQVPRWYQARFRVHNLTSHTIEFSVKSPCLWASFHPYPPLWVRSAN
jgi:hypothetical protein